jgi:processive 1,2-diacylglycerol beta-glucosyltransferase
MAKKRVWVLYATAGSGHKKAAEAIARAAKDDPSLDIHSLDIIDFMPALNKKLYSDGYLFLMSRLPWLWGIFYWFADTPALSLINVSLRRFANRCACRRFLDLLRADPPDAAVSTHFLASELVSYAKAKFGLKTKLLNVVTDFGVHNFWLAPLTDVYCCAADSTREILLKKGVAEGAIRTTGIPLDEKFRRPMDKGRMRAEFGLKSDAFTVSIVTGGIGAGPIEEIVELLKEHAQVLVVCGRNKGLYDRLAARPHERVRVFGFIDTMEKVMAASDVMVTKAGGMSVIEGLAMGLPLVFFFLIRGQEMINARTVAAHRAGVIALAPSAIRDAVLKFKTEPDLLRTYQKNASILARPDSTREIIRLI